MKKNLFKILFLSVFFGAFNAELKAPLEGYLIPRLLPQLDQRALKSFALSSKTAFAHACMYSCQSGEGLHFNPADILYLIRRGGIEF